MYIPKDFYAAGEMDDYGSKDIYAPFRNPMLALNRRILTFVTIVVPFSIFWLLLSYDRLPSFISVGHARTTSTRWDGWANVENLIVLYVTNT